MSAEDPDQSTYDSHLLYQLCSDVGFSPEQWKRRLLTSDVHNTCDSYIGRLPPIVRSASLHSGSSAEGVGMEFIGSDVDTMEVLSGTSVIEGNVVPPNETDHIFQMVHTDHPAFVHSQFLSLGAHGKSDVNLINTPEYCELDPSQRLLLNGKKIKDYICKDFHKVNGPALTDESAEPETDTVYSLHCKCWPSVSRAWITKERPFNWPSPKLISQVVNNGCELVSVTAPDSLCPDFDWRLSSSMAEKLLIRTFNIFQIQCYFLLKLILATRIKSLVPKRLASYHMKIVMLYVVEATNPGEWRENNLTNCFMICLRKLHCFLQCGYCPQYFIPQQNLFYPKVRGSYLRKLRIIATDLISEGWKCVLQCPPFNKVQFDCQHVELRCPCHLSYWEIKKYQANLASASAAFNLLSRIICETTVHFDGSVHDFIASINEIKCAHVDKPNYFPSQESVDVLKCNLDCIIGLCLMCDEENQHSEDREKNGDLGVARKLLEEGGESSIITCKLKYATFLYSLKETEKCIQFLLATLAEYQMTLPYVCDEERLSQIVLNSDYESRLRPSVYQCTETKMIYSKFTLPLMFSKWEIPACPPVIHRVAETRQRQTEKDNRFYSMMFVDPLVYIHFLFVICFRDLDKAEDSQRSLYMLERMIQNPNRYYIFYPDIAKLVYKFLEQ